MNARELEQVLESLLYEGYILYPYRPTSQKNQRERFTFGRVYPQAYSEAQGGAEPSIMQSQCLVQGVGASVSVNIRYLQPVCKHEMNWLEAIERNVTAPPQAMKSGPMRVPFRFDPCAGVLDIRTEAVADGVFRITARVANLTPFDPSVHRDGTAVLQRTFASTHTVFHVWNGSFLSLLDPPSRYRDAADACRNIGTWPVLIGDKSRADADTMLSSPIILYDYPEVAAHSPGDWYDATEIDEMLTLRVQTMTEEEKQEMRNVDAYARRILKRTENLSRDEQMAMHGTLRHATPFDDAIFGANTRQSRAVVGGSNTRTCFGPATY